MKKPRQKTRLAADAQSMETIEDFTKVAAGRLARELVSLPFDRAILFEHALDDELGKNQNISCARIVIDSTGVPRHWPQRWQPELAGTADWMLSETPWTDDLIEILDRPIAPHGAPEGMRVGDLISVKQLRRAKVRALLGTAIFEDDRIVGSLILGSTIPHAYGPTERDQLRTPEIAKLMRDMIAASQKRRRELVRNMREMFKPQLSPDLLAKNLVTTLATENDWDFVGIYRVDRQFALVASCDRTKNGALRLEPDYRQDLDIGMLGQTLQAGTCLRSDDVTVKPPPFGYTPVDGFNAKSVLCYPIFVSRKIEWILDCSSIAYAAFRGPDLEVLDELVKGLQLVLNLWFETRLSTTILDGLTEAVVVTDRDGIIRRSNRAGRALFGLVPDDSRRLAEFAVDDEGRRLLRPDQTASYECVTMMTAMRQPRELVVTSRPSSEAFAQWVYKFSDQGEDHWQAGLAYARQIVETQVGQSRAVLMLANALIARARADLTTSEAFKSTDGYLQRASEAICKTDLSYGRLVEATTDKTDGGFSKFVMNTLVDLVDAAVIAPAGTSRLSSETPLNSGIAKAVPSLTGRLSLNAAANLAASSDGEIS